MNHRAFLIRFSLLAVALFSGCGPTSSATLTTSRRLSGELQHAQGSVTASPLQNGGILFLGGAGAELYAPQNKTWTDANVGLDHGSVFHTATPLPDGTVFVAGGLAVIPNCVTQSSLMLYEPSHARWRVIGSLRHARMGHSATRLQDGQILIVGGSKKTCPPLAIDEVDEQSAELCEPATGRCVEVRNPGVARSGHAAVALPDGTVLVVGGRSVMGHSANISQPQIYNRSTDSWLAENTDLKSEVGADGITATMMHDGTVLVVGTLLDRSIPAPDNRYYQRSGAMLYSSISHSWRSVDAPALPLKYHSTTSILNGQALVVGGKISTPGDPFPTEALSQTIWTFNPATARWAQSGSLLEARALHTATLLPDGSVLIAGGECTSRNNCKPEIIVSH